MRFLKCNNGKKTGVIRLAARKKGVTIGLAVGGIIIAVVAYFMLNIRQQNATKQELSSPQSTSNKQERSTQPDSQDVDFAKKMVLVDQQAMQIADMGTRKASDANIKKLASQIYSDAQADNQKYIAWLTEWNETYLNLSDFPEMEGHDMYPTFTGMIPLSDVRQIESLSGTSFDKSFLELMVEQHEGVIELQAGRTSEGAAVKFAGILDLREENVKKQKDQIAEMKQLQRDLGYGS